MGQQEMTQRNEFVFDENGGRGTPAATFFRRLASSSADKKAGSSSANSSSSRLHKGFGMDDMANPVIGASYSHVNFHVSTSQLPQKSLRGTSFEDLDSDWDANLDNGLHSNASRSIEYIPDRSMQQQGVGFYPLATSRYPLQRNDSSLSRTSTFDNGSSPSIRANIEGIVKDPTAASIESLVSLTSPLPTSHRDSQESVVAQQQSASDEIQLSKIKKFKDILQQHNVNLNELRKVAWKGVPAELRPVTWQTLLGYLPTNSDRRVATLARKRKEYLDGVAQAFSGGVDNSIWHQISIDVPRTNPSIPLYGFEATQRALERILYLWAIRHPASGYVQGINDLVTPFFTTFLSAYVEGDVEKYDPGNLPTQVLDAVEADSFWSLSKLLDGIQDNYIHAQPGIVRQVAQLRDLTSRLDNDLAQHLAKENVEFMQFSFRWMNCLLMREISLKNTIRMWDAYLSEGSDGFSRFHVYVCAAFLVHYAERLKSMDFQEIMMFLQAMPTKDWTEKDIELRLSEAFMWQSLYGFESAHLRQPTGALAQ